MKQRYSALFLFFVILITASTTAVQAQTPYFSTAEYQKALWMTTRFYGAQRSGENNWLLYDHLPTGVDASLRGLAFIEDKDTDGYDLSGGWHDCGDHVKFGQTEFYSAYMLLKGYAEFPAGYDDYYSHDYVGYKTTGEWSWEGNGHEPNGIPDILDEVKHATDYFIKCTRNSSTFYFQVGQGDPDHATWVTAVKMQTQSKATGGQPREVYKNPNDASMASFAGATLALMAGKYRKFDPAYADLCLQHAKYAYDYAKTHPGTVGSPDGGFYPANGYWKDDYATMCAELYWATGDESYKTEALGFSIHKDQSIYDIYGNAYGFDYSNNGDIAIYNLALLGKPGAGTIFADIVNSFYLNNTQADGQFAGGNTGWGPLRYNANSALMVALWQKMQGTADTPHRYIYDNIDYVLGKNPQNQSFVVGFGANSPDFPHHRNVYLRDDNPGDDVKRTLTIPTKNRQFGQLVGGTRDASTFSDDLVDFKHTEGGIDYNACLVGALAYINSVIAPVDTNKFGHITPDLGPDQSICGLSGITLDANAATDGKKTFQWLKDDVQIYAPSTTRNSITITEAGKYTCILDSAGEWSTSGSVTIFGELPAFSLGEDLELCDPAYVTLNVNASGTGISYLWKKDGAEIHQATTSSHTVYFPGIYTATISASGCPSRSDEIIITSRLPAATHAVLCQPGTANLAIDGTGGPYEWYDAETEGNLLHTGTSFTTSVSSSTIFYVHDAGSINVTAGPSSTDNTLASPQNAGYIGIRFTAEKSFSIMGFDILPYVYSCGTNDTVWTRVELFKDGVSLGTYTSHALPCTGVQSNPPFTTYYTLTFPVPVEIPEAGSYQLVPVAGSTPVWFSSGADFAAMDAAGILDIIDDTRDDMLTSYPGIFNMKILSGSGCARTPVLATVDGSDPACTVTSIDAPDHTEILVYPNPSAEEFTIKSKENINVKVFDNLGRLLFKSESGKNLNFGEQLPSGVYHVVIYNGEQKIKSVNVIKQ